MAGKVAKFKDALNGSKEFLVDVKNDIKQVEGVRRKVGAAFLAACIMAHTLGGLSSLYFWAASKSYAESGNNPVAPGATLFALSFGIERYMGHSAANHFKRLRTVLGKMQAKKDMYDQEAASHEPLKLRQKIGHGIGRATLAVTLGAAGTVGRVLAGDPESSHHHLRRHSTLAALRLATFNGGLGLAAGTGMKLAEGRNPQAAQKALEVAQGHWPTVILVGLAVSGLLMSRKGEPAVEIPTQRQQPDPQPNIDADR